MPTPGHATMDTSQPTPPTGWLIRAALCRKMSMPRADLLDQRSNACNPSGSRSPDIVGDGGGSEDPGEPFLQKRDGISDDPSLRRCRLGTRPGHALGAKL